MKTEESTPETLIAPHHQLKLLLHSGNITLHLKRTDGIEMTYSLNNPESCFNEDVSNYINYQIVVHVESDYDLELT
ncbi:MAG: hypothetical protein V4677_14860 [Bacteroidota bacterium]